MQAIHNIIPQYDLHFLINDFYPRKVLNIFLRYKYNKMRIHLKFLSETFLLNEKTSQR